MLQRAFLVFLLNLVAAYSADYFPLAKGNSWNYQMNRDSGGYSGSALTMRLEIFSDTCIENDSILPSGFITSFLFGNDTIHGYFLKKGNDVFTNDSMLPVSEYYKFMEHQPVAGHTWNDSAGHTYKLVYWGSATVLAGTFDSCFAVVIEKDSLAQIFAPDVGLIKTLSHGNIQYQLTAFHVGSAGVFSPKQLSTVNQHNVYQKFWLPGDYSLVDVSGRFIGNVVLDKTGKIVQKDQHIPSGEFFLVPKNRNSGDLRKAEKFLYNRR
jgi:hypothetical protein